MSPRIDTSTPIAKASEHSLAFNADAVAITLALAFAVLIRLNVIPHIGW